MKTAGPHRPIAAVAVDPWSLTAMSVTLVTSATSAVRPYATSTRRSRHHPRPRRRPGHVAADTQCERQPRAPIERQAPSADSPRGTRAPRTCPRRAVRRTTRAVPRRTSVGTRTRNVASSATASTSAASRIQRPPASTTMNANEIGSAARYGGRSARSAHRRRSRPPMIASAAHGAPGRASSTPNATAAPPPSSTSTRGTQRSTSRPPAPRRRGCPNRRNPCRPRGARRPTRARRPRDRRRSAHRAFDSSDERLNTPALNCVPGPLRSSATRSAGSAPAIRAGGRHRVEGDRHMDDRGPTKPEASTAAAAALVVVSPATGAKKSIRRNNSTDTGSCRRTRSNSDWSAVQACSGAGSSSACRCRA